MNDWMRKADAIAASTEELGAEAAFQATADQRDGRRRDDPKAPWTRDEVPAMLLRRDDPLTASAFWGAQCEAMQRDRRRDGQEPKNGASHEPEIAREVRALGHKLAEVEKLAAVLMERLLPVSTPTTQGSGNPPEPVKPVNTPLGSDLRALQQVADDIERRLASQILSLAL